MNGARGLLINITGGDDLTLFEVDQAANRIREEVDEEANIIFGSAIDPELQGRIRVSVVATGIDSPAQIEREKPRLVAVGGGAMPQPIPLPLQAMSLPAAAMAGSAPVMKLHPLRQDAPQVLATAEVMADTAIMDVMRTASAAPRSGLFAELRPLSVEPPAEASRPSLFSTVTGAFRRRQHAPAVTAEPVPVSADPATQDPRVEQPRVSVRQTAGDEVGLDIPAFLRRQSS